MASLQMTLLLLLSLLLLHATSAGKLTEEENELRKEKCRPVESQAGTRFMRRQPVKASEYPFAAALTRITVYHEYSPWTELALEWHTEPTCSGVLISPRHILTAAHCIYANSENLCSRNLRPMRQPAESIGFFLQSDCKETKCWLEKIPHKSASVIVHPNYKPCKSDVGNDDAKYSKNDIAVVELRENVNIAFICMPEKDSVIYDQEEFESIGYGGQPTIQSVKYEFIKEEKEIIFACNMTKKNDVVKGDSGGPLVRKSNGWYHLFGIASQGVNATLITRYEYSNTVKIEGYLAGGYFADVRKHLDWICDASGVCSETTKHQEESILSPPGPEHPLEFQKNFAENGNY